MTNLLSSEKIKILKNRRLLYVFSLFTFIPLMQAFNSFVEKNHGVIFTQEKDVVINGATGVLMLGKNSELFLIILAILASFYINDEYQNGTIRNTLSLGYSRMNYYFSKWLMLALVTAIGTVVITLISIASYTAVFGFGAISGVHNLLSFTFSVLFTLYMLVLANISVFVMISFLTKSVGTAMIWNVLYILIIAFGPSFVKQIDGLNFLLDWITGTFLFYSSFAQPGAIALYPHMILVSCATILVSSIIGVYAFRKTDIK